LLQAGTAQAFGPEEKPQPGKRPVLQVGQWKEGTLTKEDAVDNVWGTRCKEYEIACEPGQTYVIDMEARTREFDPLLRLKDREGRQWASDSDGGIGSNARIVFPCTRKDTYIIVAATHAGDLGDFAVLVRNPIELRGKAVATVDSLDARAVQYLFEFRWSERPFRAYPIKLERGKTYVVEATARDDRFRPILLLRTTQNWSKTGDANRQGAATAQITYSCDATDIYFVIVTTTDPARTGSFELRIRESSDPK
jgi:hypothetical protein